MSTLVAPRLYGTQETVVSPYGFEMTVTYDYDPGEPPIWSPMDRAHPGCPPCCELLTCKVAGVDITEMLSSEQRGRIEEVICDQMES